jgi:membrane protease YdiL (CAAX protease family)
MLDQNRPTAAVKLPTMDWSNWRLDRGRLAAAGCVLAYAVALGTTGGTTTGLVGALLAVEVALLCLPWRLPRERRGRLSFWAESLTGLSAPIGALVVVAVSRPDWLTRGVDWWWWAAGVATGAGLVLLGRIDLRALASGELAFLLGPTRHGRARATVGALAPFGEEALFRGPVLAAPASAVGPIGLLAAVAFVALHFVQPGDNARGSTRAMVVAIVAAAALLVLAIGSGSIYPGLVAHVLNNVPGVVLELQRHRAEGVT